MSQAKPEKPTEAQQIEEELGEIERCLIDLRLRSRWSSEAERKEIAHRYRVLARVERRLIERLTIAIANPPK